MFLDFMPASKRTSHLLKVADSDRVILLGRPGPHGHIHWRCYFQIHFDVGINDDYMTNDYNVNMPLC